MSKIAKEARERAMATGQLPHEILLDMARGNPQPVKTAELDEESGELKIEIVKWEMPTMEERRDAAKAAAPYYAPKISTVEVIAGVTDDDLTSLIASLASEAGLSLGPQREGEEGEEEEGASTATRTPPAVEGSGQPTGVRRRALTGTRSGP